MTTPDKELDQQQIWKSLAEAGLVEIRLADFPDRIKDAKQSLIVRLGELFESKADIRERESAAHSLGTLKKLETTLQANAPRLSERGV